MFCYIDSKISALKCFFCYNSSSILNFIASYKANGSAKVKLGATDVIASVKVL